MKHDYTEAFNKVQEQYTRMLTGIKESETLKIVGATVLAGIAGMGLIILGYWLRGWTQRRDVDLIRQVCDQNKLPMQRFEEINGKIVGVYFCLKV